jgi:hypothetical protein
MGNVFFLLKVMLGMLKSVRLPRRSAPRNDKGYKYPLEE